MSYSDNQHMLKRPVARKAHRFNLSELALETHHERTCEAGIVSGQWEGMMSWQAPLALCRRCRKTGMSDMAGAHLPAERSDGEEDSGRNQGSNARHESGHHHQCLAMSRSNNNQAANGTHKITPGRRGQAKYIHCRRIIQRYLNLRAREIDRD